MNDVLAVFMISLAIDFSESNGTVLGELHSPKYFWSEAYFMYEAIMRMGVKGIYFREGNIIKNSNKPKGKTVCETISRNIEVNFS